MSNRSLFEFNHDYSHRIEKNPSDFAEDVIRYLKSGNEKDAENLERRYGLKWFGMRHHSDTYYVQWGFYTEEG